jgi:hypothetical protein
VRPDKSYSRRHHRILHEHSISACALSIALYQILRSLTRASPVGCSQHNQCVESWTASHVSYRGQIYVLFSKVCCCFYLRECKTSCWWPSPWLDSRRTHFIQYHFANLPSNHERLLLLVLLLLLFWLKQGWVLGLMFLVCRSRRPAARSTRPIPALPLPKRR